MDEETIQMLQNQIRAGDEAKYASRCAFQQVLILIHI